MPIAQAPATRTTAAKAMAAGSFQPRPILPPAPGQPRQRQAGQHGDEAAATLGQHQASGNHESHAMHGAALRRLELLIAIPAASTNQGANIAASELVRAKVAIGSLFFTRSSKCCRWGEPGAAHTPAARMVPSGSALYWASVAGHLDRALIQTIARQRGGQGDHRGDHRPRLPRAAQQLAGEEETQSQARPFPEHVKRPGGGWRGGPPTGTPARSGRPTAPRRHPSEPKRRENRRLATAPANQQAASTSQSMTTGRPSPCVAAASLGNSGRATQRAVAAANSQGRSRSASSPPVAAIDQRAAASGLAALSAVGLASPGQSGSLQLVVGVMPKALPPCARHASTCRPAAVRSRARRPRNGLARRNAPLRASLRAQDRAKYVFPGAGSDGPAEGTVHFRRTKIGRPGL